MVDVGRREDRLLDAYSAQLVRADTAEKHIDQTIAKLDVLRVEMPVFERIADELEYSLTGVRP
jgi:hypothetical protein